MDQNSSLISIIIPVYNAEAFINKCIDSIIAQSYSNIEILIIDDGSTDKSGLICKEYAYKDSRIRYIYKENAGISSARNAGLDEARGDWILFVDSDDWIESDLCKKCIDAAYTYDSDILVFGLYKAYPNRIDRLYIELDNGLLAKKQAMNLLGDDRFGNYPCNKLFKREVFKEIRYPLGKYLEDVGTTYLLFELADNIAFLNEYLYYYNQHKGSIMHKNSKKKIIDQFELRYRQNEFFKAKYPQAIENSKEALINCAVKYLMWSVKYGDLRQDNLFECANEVIVSNKITLSNTKLKIFVFAFMYKHCKPLFNMATKVYLG